MTKNKIRFPSIKAVASALADAKRWIEKGDWVDVRLQVYDDGAWTVHTGDASYDQDHRGYWGSSSLKLRSNTRDVARELISEAEDHYAQCGDAD